MNIYEEFKLEQEEKAKRINGKYEIQEYGILPTGFISKANCGHDITELVYAKSGTTIIVVPDIELVFYRAKQDPMHRFVGEGALAVSYSTSYEDIQSYMSTEKNHDIVVTYHSLEKVIFVMNNYKCNLVFDKVNELLTEKTYNPELVKSVFKIAENYKDILTIISEAPIAMELLPQWVLALNHTEIEFSNILKTEPVLKIRTNNKHKLANEFIALLTKNKLMPETKDGFRKVLLFLNSVSSIWKLIKDGGFNENKYCKCNIWH